MPEKTVSVIVPVYKVEKYLRKCVDSITHQTYRNLEIILVDDGSPDNCGKLCDELAKADERIKVIHKKNGGLSDARNVGLDISTGDLIGFVDSDDYIDKDFYEILVGNIMKYNADVSCCRYTNVWENGKSEKVGNDGNIYIYEGLDALKEYLYGKTLDPFAWNKLYKAELLGNVTYRERKHRFVNGILGEDNPFCIELFKETQKVVLEGLSKYNYLQARKGAITNSGITKKILDVIYQWNSVRLDCHKNYPELEKYALRRQVLFYIGLYNTVCKNESFKSEAEKVRAFIKEHNKEIQSSDICEKTVKLSAELLAFSPSIYRVFMRIYKKIIGRARL